MAVPVIKILKYLVKSSGSQSVVSRPAASVWPGPSIERHVSGFHLRPPESEPPEIGPGNL